jgi:hypothetical protein
VTFTLNFTLKPTSICVEYNMYFTGINPTICFGFQQAFIRLCVRKQKDKTLRMKEGRFHPCYRPRRTLGRVQVYLYSVFFISAPEWGEGSASRPGRFLPPEKNRYPYYRRLGGPQGRSGRVRKISPPPGFDPRTVEPLASRYNDWATGPLQMEVHISIFHLTLIYQRCS